MKQFWVSFVEDKFGLDNAIQTNAEFSHVIAAMDRIGGWEEAEGEQENWAGARFAASIWIYTKAVEMQRTEPHAKLQDLQIKI